jgi:hypothetical protein
MRREHSLTAAIALALAAAALLLHTGGLEAPQLAPREMELSACAEGPVTGRRDRLPIFIKCTEDVSLPPVPVYTSVAMRGVWPIPPQRIRLGPAIVGALDVVLIFVLALRLFASPAIATLTALVLLATPGHVTFSRVASEDGIWVLPFVLVWLIAIAAMTEDAAPVRRRRAAVAGLIAAGLALYAQPSGAMLAVGMLALTLWIGLRSGMPRADLIPAFAGFVSTLIPAAVWMVLHPSGYNDTLGRWLLHPAHIRRPADWFAAVTNWQSLTSISNVFWDFLSPTHLFINDRAPALAAVFLLPAIVPITLGARASLSRAGPQGRRGVLLIACAGSILTALIVAAFKEPRALHRGLAIVVFGALLAGAGAASLLERHKTGARATLVGVLVASVLQFWWWYARIA